VCPHVAGRIQAGLNLVNDENDAVPGKKTGWNARRRVGR
jgi:hypothetical protein